MSERPTFAQRWREYGDRPPVARWTSRISSLVGLVLGWALVLIVLFGLCYGIYIAVRLVLS